MKNENLKKELQAKIEEKGVEYYLEKKFEQLMSFTDKEAEISIADYKRILKEIYDTGFKDGEAEALKAHLIRDEALELLKILEGRIC